MLFAVTDIETTGSNHVDHAITEVSVYVTDGEKILKEYSSLVNPKRSIPPFITGLTGISNEDVAAAPEFSEIAEELLTYFEDAVFVAHNVAFDYNFLRVSFMNVGINFNKARLCTVRLSRRIFPNLNSYSLGNLCKSLDIELIDRHRAYGDAQATAVLFNKMFHKNRATIFEVFANRKNISSAIPPNLSEDDFYALPETAGVYYFKDAQNKPIYIGKAINIKKRILSHFYNARKTKTGLLDAVHKIDYTETGNELAALLLESSEINNYWPKYNTAQKHNYQNFIVNRYVDGMGFIRLGIQKNRPSYKSQLFFKTYNDARAFVEELCKENGLCDKLCGLHLNTEKCYNNDCTVCQGEERPTEYNERLLNAIEKRIRNLSTFVIKENGRSESEDCYVLIDKLKYMGFGFIPKSYEVKTLKEIKEHIQSHKDNQDIQRILRQYININHEQLISFETA
ncbi:MAG: GIY-YIG nuclease family protein [Flavobacteriales bacterium]|nr:GIY-YIG nuclease family protein [Flavobacteriales bacterium]